MKALFAFSIMAILLFPSFHLAWGQSYQAALTLDPLPSSVKVGEKIIFSGRLVTTDGKYVVPGRTIYIKDDVSFGVDTIIGSIVTDDNGRYSGSWTAKPRNDGGAYDFYAVFEGDQYVSKARSQTYSVNVQGSSDKSTSTYERQPTKIMLDRLPPYVYAGESITFTGTLTSNAKPVLNAVIKIMEDDPLSPDTLLSSGYTDSGGRFNIAWQVTKDYFETDFDIYASFDGNSNYVYARSPNQIMSVLRFSGSITLDPLPQSAKIGNILTFTGSLRFDKGSPEGAIVYIKDEDPASADDLLATAYVAKDGRFSANWFVTETDVDLIADIYAVFEGNDRYYRLTTCDQDPTMDYGGSCIHTRQLKTYYETKPSPVQPAPTSGNEYMELLYSLDFTSKPHVAIVPSPDSYDLARKYVVSTQEGILMWKSHLASKYGGGWEVDFEVVTDDKIFFSSRPDIVVNLVTPEKEFGCKKDFYGVSYPTTRKPIQTSICVVFGNTLRSASDVSATAAHEFIHAMGLGHAWNKKGDLMCSAEMIQGRQVYTCPYSITKSKNPSELNLGSVVYLYGEDGYKNPNYKVSSGAKYYLDTDRDGVPDYKDKCKTERETKNGYNDEDGCPDKTP